MRSEHLIGHTAAPSPRISAYKQGEFDELCGIYAIINSIRWSIRQHPLASKGPHWNDLFGILNHYAVTELSNLTIASSGLGLNSMIWLVRTAQEHMLDVHKLTILTERLFALGKPNHPNQIRENLFNHLSKSNSSALFALYGRINHWTVPTALTHSKVKLFDSSHFQFMSEKSLHVTDIKSKNKHHTYTQPSSLICFSAQLK